MVRAAGAGATAAAAAGGAIAAAVAATGRGVAVGDRGRGCRRRSGWVRPGPGRVGPLPLGRLPGLCVGPGGREQQRRPRPSRGDAPVGPGARGGARRRASGRPGRLAAPAGRDKGAPRPGNSASFPPQSLAERSSRAASKLSTFPLVPVPVTGPESLSFLPQVRASFFCCFLSVRTQTQLVIFFFFSVLQMTVLRLNVLSMGLVFIVKAKYLSILFICNTTKNQAFKTVYVSWFLIVHLLKYFTVREA